MAREPFVWGQGGAKLTPKQIEDRRKVAQALMARGADFSPAGHWTEALGRAFNGWIGGKQAGEFNRQEEAGTAAARAKMEGRYSGSPVAAALAGSGGGGYVPPQRSPYSMGQDAEQPLFANEITPGGYAMGADVNTSSPEYIRQGLIARGLPEHVAEGFLMNFGDESGFDSGINEISPLVPGSRGGFGLYQLTGPRRTAYEAFAADRGVDPSDTDAQLDWLMYELQGPEAQAAANIFSAGNAGEAGAAIVNHFLRPSPEHRTSRANKYMGMTGAPQMGGGSQEILGLMADPWVQEQYGSVLGAELGAAQSRENAIFQQQLAMQDPAYQLGLERQQLELDQMRNPGKKPPLEINGQLVDPDTLMVLGDYRTISPQDSERYRAVGGQVWDFAPEGGGAPTLVGGGQEEIVYGPDGQPIFTRGPSGSGKPLTEGQSKDVVYSTRAEGALAGLEGLDASVLTSRSDAMLDMLPMGLGREVQSAEFQQAQNLGNEFLQAVLRKDTGAAITEQEQKLYGDTYLPRPGDSPAVLETKKVARARAVEAMKAGMDARQVAMQQQAMIEAVRKGGAVADTTAAPKRMRYNPATGAFE